MSREEWHFLETRRLSWPAPWEELFGRLAPLWVEIGFGNGRFLLDLANTYPAANLVGVEISQPALRKVQQKVSARALQNVCLVHATAREALWTLFAPDTIDAAFINFPDPWPKAAHHQRRLVDEPFLHLLASRLRPGANLEIATDHEEYGQVICHHLQRSPHFESRLGVPFVSEDPERIPTKYERKAKEVGSEIRYFRWQCNEGPLLNRFPIPEEYPMPHVILRSPLSLESLMQRFQPDTHPGQGATVRFIEIFESQNYPSLLVDTYIDEEPIAQRLGLRVRRKSTGELVLGLHELGFPRATLGVHQALYFLWQEIQELEPETDVINSNLKVG